MNATCFERSRRLAAPLIGLIAVVGLIVAAPPVAAAEAGLGAPAQGGRGRAAQPPAAPNPETMTPQQVSDYFDDVVLFRAQTQLQLTDDQFLPFGAKLKNLQRLRRQLQLRRSMMLRDFTTLLAGPAVDEATVSAKLKELDDTTAEFDRQIQAAYQAIDETLTPRQRLRFRVFEDNMERLKNDLIAQARQKNQARAAGRGAAGPPSGTPPAP